MALELAEQGHAVAVNYLTSEDEARRTVAEIETGGGRAIAVQGDVGDRAQVDQCFRTVEEAFGPITILVNNAGIRSDSLAATMSDDAWNAVIRADLYGTFACCRRAIKGMTRARWGRIVNVASSIAVKGWPGQVNYAAAKAGVVGLTRTLALEVARTGITVNAVCPGLVQTEILSDLTDEQRARLLSSIPLGRAGTLEEVASMVLYLCSEQAGYTTAAIFIVDGGRA